MGSLPTGESLLVVIDYYSRFYKVVIMHSTTAKRVMHALTQRYSADINGSQFCCEEFEKFLFDHGIEHMTSPPLWPQANGQTLLKTLKVVHVELKNWHEELQKFLLAYRTTTQASTGVRYSYIPYVWQRVENQTSRIKER